VTLFTHPILATGCCLSREREILKYAWAQEVLVHQIFDETADPLTVTPTRILGFAFGFQLVKPTLNLGNSDFTNLVDPAILDELLLDVPSHVSSRLPQRFAIPVLRLFQIPFD
jgi:hypothetical protein